MVLVKRKSTTIILALALGAATLSGCALMMRPSMADIGDEMGMDLLSSVLTALDADDFGYFMTSFDVTALASARGLAPVTTSTLPQVKEIIQGHFAQLRELKGKMASGLSFYSSIGSRAGPIQLSIAGALTSTPLDAGPPPVSSFTPAKNRGFWFIRVGDRSLKVRLVRNGAWKMEDIEWDPGAR